jgi:hypothetical protein
MNLSKYPLRTVAVIVCAVIALLCSGVALGHCDSLDGPVVTAGRKALETGNVKLVLVWVQEKDEPEIADAFGKTLAVRKLSAEARELADMYFFETLVRVHRAGEGAPYTGLKAIGGDPGPAIVAAERALASGSVEPVMRVVSQAVREGMQKRFHEAVDAAKYAPDDVEAGRRFVRAYVEFIHYAERVYDAAASRAGGHLHENDRSEAGQNDR